MHLLVCMTLQSPFGTIQVQYYSLTEPMILFYNDISSPRFARNLHIEGPRKELQTPDQMQCQAGR